MKVFKFKVTKKDPKRLGSFLGSKHFSKQAILNAKHNGGMILVNKKRRYTNFILKNGDFVYFAMGEEKLNKYLKPSNAPIDICFETENYLVINKEAGVLSIPSRYEDDSALVNRVLGYFSKRPSSEQKFLKPHVVTRLDRDTSGLVLIGSNALAHGKFSELKKDVFIKKYHAIVHGNFETLTGLIEAPIGKVGSSVKRAVKVDGQYAATKYRVLEQKNGASLVELQLLTGRTHQIRVHMSYLGHPLYGDELYGANDDFSRQALNCYYLSFPDPFTNKIQEIQIAEPIDMQNLWSEL